MDKALIPLNITKGFSISSLIVNNLDRLSVNEKHLSILIHNGVLYLFTISLISGDESFCSS